MNVAAEDSWNKDLVKDVFVTLVKELALVPVSCNFTYHNEDISLKTVTLFSSFIIELVQGYVFLASSPKFHRSNVISTYSRHLYLCWHRFKTPFQNEIVSHSQCQLQHTVVDAHSPSCIEHSGKRMT